MKVAYLLNIFPKISETFILNEMIAMQDKGVSIEVFACTDAKEEKVHPRVKEIKGIHYFFKANFFQILYAHLYWLFKNPLGYFRTLGLVLRFGDKIRMLFVTRLYDLMRVYRAKPDHIHAHFGEFPGDTSASNLAMVMNRLSGIPYTFTTHSFDIFDYPAKNYPLKSSLAKKHIVISEFNKKYLSEQMKVDKKYMEIVHCGIDFGRLPDQRSNGASREKNLILSIARLHKQKGLDCLIRACRQLKEWGIEFQCVIIGDGEERQELQKLIKALCIEDRVQLLGNKSQDEVFEWLGRANVMVLPSFSEGIPVSLMEAMAFRVPVIASNICGIPELIEDGKSGFLTPAGKPEILAHKIKELLDNETLQKSFAENGYRKVYEKFNLKTETDKLLKIWAAPKTETSL